MASSSLLYEDDRNNLLSILFSLSKLVDMGPEEGEKYLQEVGTQRYSTEIKHRYGCYFVKDLACLGSRVTYLFVETNHVV